ncbi:Di-/tripeptide transporter [Aquisphaera giovannonii]|uniref:Di-/tripeptide transporter n=1 Tax=Aquisphaera giovannonii TaxID=406548 RepID=A0A5B9W9D1_9BACT|nr:peptide MFS transporter [Aquisphaera giovannonii]QEH36839.1 Di-/tripeptide transporter [Aquisphaera giovannonii]
MSQPVGVADEYFEGSAGPEPKERHPWGLYALFATEMWERFGFYTAAAIMTLYLQRGGFGWSREKATDLWSYYLMFVYATPLVGGWLADKYLGYRRSVLIGGVLFVLGYAMLGRGTLETYYPALALIFAGNGFFKPNISTMVGNLYPAGSRLKDSAYNIFYMGINVGALLAPIVAEVLLQTIAGNEVLELAKKGTPLSAPQAADLRSAFLAAFNTAALGLTLGTVLFLFLYKSLAAVERPHALADHASSEVALAEDLAPAAEASELEKVPERNRILALLTVYGIVIVFWMVFHQNGSTMTYWADENTDWNVSGVISNSINAFWIVVLSIPLVWFWGWLGRRGLEPSTPVKILFGMLLTSLAFFILYVAAKSGGDQTFLTDEAGNLLRDAKGAFKVEQHRVSPAWLISAYMVISLGELMLSPMGLSLVSKVAPVRMRGLMMGGWFVATAIGNKLTAIGKLWDPWYHSSFWLLCCLSALGMALVLMVILKPLKRAMPGV